MPFGAVLPDLLGPAQLQEIETRLCDNAVRLLAEAGAAALSSGSVSALAPWLTELSRLLSECPEKASVIIRHWSTSYFLTQCPHESEAAGRLLSGSIFELAERCAKSGLPVIPNGRDALLIHDLPRPGDDAGLLPLTESLDCAFDLIEGVWPEVISWVRALIPAIADVGPSPSPRMHLSGSYGAGLPIYLSRVNEPWFHAEDLLHELQHQRFHFAVPSGWFARWHAFSFISPYRCDPRPLSGLHLGLHAFVAVNELRLRHLRNGTLPDSLLREMLRTHRQNLFVYRTVMAHEKLTAEGARFYAEMEAILERQSEAIEPLAPAHVARAVETALEEHAQRVCASDPRVENQGLHFGAAPYELAAGGAR